MAVALALLLAVLDLGIGLWAFLVPGSFARLVAPFAPYNLHYLHDVGAFQVGLGVALLAGLRWRTGLAVAFAGNLAAAAVHLASHVEDARLGGHPYFDIPALAVVAAAAGAGLALTVRQARPT